MSTPENTSKNRKLLERTGFPPLRERRVTFHIYADALACTRTQTGRHSGAFYETITLDGLVKSQKLELLPQLIGIAKVVNTPYIAVTKISPDFLRNHHT